MTIRAAIAGLIMLAGLAAAHAGEVDPPAGPANGTAPPIRAPGAITYDARGLPVVDPSENVKALNEAGIRAMADRLTEAIKRQDDLRGENTKWITSEIKRIDEIAALSRGYEIKISDLIRIYSDKISDAESKRIDANRAADSASQEKASALALNSIKELTAQAFAASKEAITKQENSADKRADQSRSELAVQFKSLDEKIILLTTQNNYSSGAYGAIIVGVGLAIGLVGLISGRVRLGPAAPAPPYPPYPYPYPYPPPPPYHPPPYAPPSQPPPGRRRATDQSA